MGYKCKRCGSHLFNHEFTVKYRATYSTHLNEDIDCDMADSGSELKTYECAHCGLKVREGTILKAIEKGGE